MAEGAASEPLGIVVFDGRFDRVHYALVMAGAAAAVGRDATLFFTGRAVRALEPEGWRGLDGEPEAAEARFAAAGVATFAALTAACRDLGVRVLACEMGLRAEGLAAEALDPAFGAEIAGMVTLLERARGGQIVFV
jgi:peroxiredoxin family protein